MTIYEFLVTLSDGSTKKVEAASEESARVKIGWKVDESITIVSIENLGEIVKFNIS